MTEYRVLALDTLDRALFSGFIRYQIVTQCLRNVNGHWCVQEDPFIDDWNETDYKRVLADLRRTATAGGFVLGAFVDDILKGFVNVEPDAVGSQKQYFDLPYLHVSNDMRGQGLGRELFARAAQWARERGAKKLYISAHSAVESQAFYRAMGCVEAAEYLPLHVETEPYDCQLEYAF